MRTSPPARPQLDYTQFHHAFFMGDLNYRLDPLFAQDVFPISLSRDEIWNKIVGLTDKGSEGYAELHKADELDKCVEKALLCYCCCYYYYYYYARVLLLLLLLLLLPVLLLLLRTTTAN